MKTRYDVSDLPYLIFIDVLDAIEASASKEFDTTVPARWADDAAAQVPGAEIWRRDE